jgi:hypothetical protein
MTAPAGLRLASGGEAADLAAFLGRLIRWDKAAVVRLRAAEGEPALGVFGHPPFGGVLAVMTAALDRPTEVAAAVDATVSAGQLLDAVEAATAPAGGETGSAAVIAELVVPGSVTGPAWAGLLPPRSGWRRVAELDAVPLRESAVQVIREFRTRTEGLPVEQRTRAELDALAEELWTRSYALGGPGDPGGPGLPLRVVHAAHALGFLRGDGAVFVLVAGPWLRLRTGGGSVAFRGGSPASGLSVSPA